ncbi:MAG: UMP kinase [Negativicutes bacterium]|nr:UMP kinase [Negativicutes bacterium]
MQPKYRRVLLKLSGEALAGGSHQGLDSDTLLRIAGAVKSVREAGVEVAIVNGGGNFWRGLAGSQRGMGRVPADYIGMLATVMNGIAVQDALDRIGVANCLMTAIEMRQLAEPYNQRRALEQLTGGNVVIFGAGTGSPYFSTDTLAALRAAEIGAELVLMGKNGVDGIYDADPRQDRTARRFERLTYQEIISRNLRAIDLTAAVFCWENKIPMAVFDIDQPQNIGRIIAGQPVGTLVEG